MIPSSICACAEAQAAGVRDRSNAYTAGKGGAKVKEQILEKVSRADGGFEWRYPNGAFVVLLPPEDIQEEVGEALQSAACRMLQQWRRMTPAERQARRTAFERAQAQARAELGCAAGNAREDATP